MAAAGEMEVQTIESEAICLMYSQCSKGLSRKVTNLNTPNQRKYILKPGTKIGKKNHLK